MSFAQKVLLALLTATVIASPSHSQDAPRRTTPAGSQTFTSRPIPPIPADELFMEGITVDKKDAERRVRPGGGRIARYMWCRFGPEGGSRKSCSRTASQRASSANPPAGPGDQRISALAQREEDQASRRVRPGRGRIARYMWCRFGPEGGSRDTCSQQANS